MGISLKDRQAPIIGLKTSDMFEVPCLRYLSRLGHHLVKALVDVMKSVEEVVELQNVFINTS